MKILHIIDSLGDGGAERMLSNICINESTNKHIVVSLTNEGKYSKILKKNRIKLFHLNIKNGLRIITGLIELRRIIKNTSPDIVFTWLYYSILIGSLTSKICKINNIHWNIRHSDISSKRLKIQTKIVVRICSILSNYIPTKIVYCSNQSFKNHTEVGYNKHKSIIIYNGVDTNEFKQTNKKNELKKILKIPNKSPIIGMIARYSADKDYMTLIESFNILKNKNVNFFGIMVGKGVNKNKILLRKIEEYKLNKYLKLFGSKEKINEIMNIIDIGVLSSFSESFPNVLTELMSTKIPCISTNQGESRNIIGKTGWIFKTGDSKNLSFKINKAIKEFNNKKVWNIRKINARRRVQKLFTNKIMIDHYKNLWNNKSYVK